MLWARQEQALAESDRLAQIVAGGGGQIVDPRQRIAEFYAWLDDDPSGVDITDDRTRLHRILGVA